MTGDGGAAAGDLADLTVLVVDNYDSFAYNLVQYVGQFVGRVEVERNDAVTLADVRALDPDGVVVSPGPGTPAEAGISMPLFRDETRPTLGVCLGHQALCAAHGARVGHAPSVVHGKASPVTHDGRGVFSDLPDPLSVGRYHSLAVERGALPDCLAETAHTVSGGGPVGGDAGPDPDTAPADPDAGLVMAVRHRERPHVGVQFHPESVLTDCGLEMVRSFLEVYCGDRVR